MSGVKEDLLLVCENHKSIPGRDFMWHVASSNATLEVSQSVLKCQSKKAALPPSSINRFNT